MNNNGGNGKNPNPFIGNPRRRPHKLIEEADFIGAGFKKVDSKFLDDNAPKVDWDKMFALMSRRKGYEMTTEQKMTWFKKFACSMNYAASMIQSERDQLARLLMKKEQMLTKQTASMDSNNNMIQTEVTRMNAERQSFNEHTKKLNDEIRKLKQEIQALKNK